MPRFLPVTQSLSAQQRPSKEAGWPRLMKEAAPVGPREGGFRERGCASVRGCSEPPIPETEMCLGDWPRAPQQAAGFSSSGEELMERVSCAEQTGEPWERNTVLGVALGVACPRAPLRSVSSDDGHYDGQSSREQEP